MAAPSGAEHGAARGGRAPRAEAGVAMPGVRPHLGAGRRTDQQLKPPPISSL